MNESNKEMADPNVEMSSVPIDSTATASKLENSEFQRAEVIHDFSALSG
jgi:hypothetical protein